MGNPNAYVDAEENVILFLAQLQTALKSDCQLDILLTKKNQNDTDPFSTAYTMQVLGFTKEDIRKILMSLKVRDYVENMKDSVNTGSADFRVFGVIIKKREIYIKIKIRRRNNIFCISFHFAEFPLKKRPYNYDNKNFVESYFSKNS